jgi:hypothetical protein
MAMLGNTGNYWLQLMIVIASLASMQQAVIDYRISVQSFIMMRHFKQEYSNVID